MVWRFVAIVVVALSGACMPRQGMVGAAPGVSARCRVGASQTSVLVTEWSAAEKANLEAMLRSGGAVAVEFSGCQMRVLPQCKLPGHYSWTRTTPTTDVLEIQNEAQLYAKLPLGAVSLSTELARSGSLYVETTVSGQHRLQGASTEWVPNNAECEFATHLVGATSIGAFVLSAGGRTSVAAGAELGVTSAGGQLSQSSKVLKYAGDARACGYGTDEAAAVECSSPVQVFLEPIPGRAEVEGAPGTVKVDFQSGSAVTRWDVYVKDEATCTTPCSTWVDPVEPVVLQTRPGQTKLRVANLGGATGPVQVVAHPTSQGRLATGIVFTAFGGMAVVTGIALTATGFASDRDGMGTAGLIAGGVGAGVTAGGIVLMLSSVAHYQVRPLFGTTMALGPTGVSGTF